LRSSSSALASELELAVGLNDLKATPSGVRWTNSPTRTAERLVDDKCENRSPRSTRCGSLPSKNEAELSPTSSGQAAA
jgi:hypothetical protein